MAAEHFTRTDLIGVALGTLLLAGALIPPGFLFAWTCNLFAFRKQTWPWQLLTSVPLSIGIAPIVTFLLWSYLGQVSVWIFYALAALFFVACSMKSRHGSIPRWALAAMLGWLLIVWISGIDLQFGNRLYVSFLSYDFNIRTAMIDGIARTGLPPRNALFYPGHAVPLRYHYFWLIFCALVDLAGGALVDARQALVASDVWCGWAVMATIVLYLRFFHPAGGRALEKRARWAIAMLAIAGLDIVPVVIVEAMAKFHFVYPSVEWWNSPVMGWVHAMLWVAHHISSLVACFAGFLLLWHAPAERGRRFWGMSAGAGLCFASAAGLSIYIVFTFGLFMVVWGLRVIGRRRIRDSYAWSIAGGTTVIAALPYLRGLQGAGGGSGPPVHFAMFAIREFKPLETLLRAFGAGSVPTAIANLVALPVNYFLETGIWFLLACVWIKRLWRKRAHLAEIELASLVLFCVSIFVGSFLRSGVIANNDLGWRSTTLAQLILLIWSVDPLRAWWRSRRSTRFRIRWKVPVTALVILGIGSTVYEVTVLRVFLPLADAKLFQPSPWVSSDGRLVYDARTVYTRLRQVTPPDAVLQGNPTHWNDVLHGLYAMRQTASFDAACGSEMGGGGDCAAMQAQLAPLFTNPAAAESADIDPVCRTWGIDVLVAKKDDPVFSDRRAWPWLREPVASAETVRAIPCGNGLSRP